MLHYGENAAIRQLVLRYQILIAMAEKEDFVLMPRLRIAVVIAQLESRLRRLSQALIEHRGQAEGPRALQQVDLSNSIMARAFH